ncbi:MAG: hypothetical protein CM1200mP30_09540 [Pseudomonadota bacterium]|nr:MAG: hypothetical protein CM1200mP30_09540 [Pseudomonadota bacterium]
MCAIAYFFLGYIFKDFLTGTELLSSGEEVELWRSYLWQALYFLGLLHVLQWF